jgi:hypothetical protein
MKWKASFIRIWEGPGLKSGLDTGYHNMILSSHENYAMLYQIMSPAFHATQYTTH